MLKSQLLTIELSENRQKINDLLAFETRSKEQDTELETVTKRAQAIEPELRAALTAEGTAEAAGLDGQHPGKPRTAGAGWQGKHRAGLCRRPVEHRAVDGAEAEIQAHYKLDGNQIPLIMLRGESVKPAPLHPAPGDVGQTQSMIIPGVVSNGLRCVSWAWICRPWA